MSRRRIMAPPVVVALLLTGCGEGSVLSPASREAGQVAGLWWILLAAGTAVYLLVLALLAVPLVRSRRRPEEPSTGADAAEDAVARRRLVVLVGVVLPVIVVAGVVVLGAVVGRAVAPAATDDDLVIEVTGHQFWWEVRYPGLDVVTANEIHVPVDRPVRLQLHSADVIHSFWVPELHGKIDLRPGAETTLSFRVAEAGSYRGRCAEYCGLSHAMMALLVAAETPAEFETWLEEQAEPADEPDSGSAKRGRDLFADSCAACHTVRGHTTAPGDGETFAPDLTHLASRRSIAAGTLDNTREALRRWVVAPHLVKAGVPMPAADLAGDELQALLDYLEGLR